MNTIRRIFLSAGVYALLVLAMPFLVFAMLMDPDEWDSHDDWYD